MAMVRAMWPNIDIHTITVIHVMVIPVGGETTKIGRSIDSIMAAPSSQDRDRLCIRHIRTIYALFHVNYY